jgi:tetratricopeptide (TPR) repeat protein
MSDRPMHTVPGLFDRLTALYADGERAVADGRLDDADAAFGQIVALDDHFRQRWITAYAQRAFVRHRQGRLEEAVADYTSALGMNEPAPHQAQYRFQRGMALEALGRVDEALPDFTAAAEAMPDQPGPWHLRGKLLCARLGRPADALADFDRFLTLADHPEVRQLRAWCLLQLGRAAEALPDLDRALAALADPWTRYLAAWATAATGDVDRCLTAMTECVRLDPSFATYFRDLPDYAAVRADPRFAAAVPA